jgi:RNA polymerase sigma factor (TIGR02999 family)
MAARHDITQLLRDWANGAPSALEALTPLVYTELRRLAGSYMRSEAPGHTLQPTALVHEAFLRMVARDAPDCENRSHFYGVASHLMRQILIDHARTRHAGKRGGGKANLSLDENLVVSREREADLVALDHLATGPRHGRAHSVGPPPCAQPLDTDRREEIARRS